MIKAMGKTIDYIKKIEKENKELKKENKELKEENMIIKKLSVKRDDENKKLEEENEAFKKEINGIQIPCIGDDASNEISSFLKSIEFNKLASGTQKTYEKCIRCIMSGEGDNACGVKHGMTLSEACVVVKDSAINIKRRGPYHAVLKKFITFLE